MMEIWSFECSKLDFATSGYGELRISPEIELWLVGSAFLICCDGPFGRVELLFSYVVKLSTRF